MKKSRSDTDEAQKLIKQDEEAYLRALQESIYHDLERFVQKGSNAQEAIDEIIDEHEKKKRNGQ